MLIVADVVLTRGSCAWVTALAHVLPREVEAAPAGRWLRHPLTRFRRENPDVMPVVKLLQPIEHADMCARVLTTATLWAPGADRASPVATSRRTTWTVPHSDAALLDAADEEGHYPLTFDHDAADAPMVIREEDQIAERDLVAMFPAPSAAPSQARNARRDQGRHLPSRRWGHRRRDALDGASHWARRPSRAR